MDKDNYLHNFAPIPVRAALDKELGAALRVLVLIAAHVDKDGTCFPSQGTIAKALGIRRQAVNRHVQKLKELSYLAVIQQSRENGSNTACLYRVLYDLPQQRDVAPPAKTDGHTLQPLEVAPSATSGSCTHNIPIEQTNKNKRANSKFSLPDWVDPDDWNGFEELRRIKKKPLTDRARLIHIKTLQELKAQGYDPAAIIQQSIMKGWGSFYKINRQEAKTMNCQSSPLTRQQEQEASQRLMDELMEGAP